MNSRLELKASVSAWARSMIVFSGGGTSSGSPGIDVFAGSAGWPLSSSSSVSGSASGCLTHLAEDLPLVTDDARHFERVDGLVVEGYRHL